jgi:hypothetical protein
VSTSVLGLDPATYVSHTLHHPERAWQQTNCYVDLWIETLHGLGLEPTAALPFTVGLDFEGDQYTFFKFPLGDLQELYGIEVQELNVWRPLIEHAAEQAALGRIMMPEVDSWFLPDTKGVSYRLDHVKSSIAIQHIDVAAQTLGYFHNSGYHSLAGEDFRGVFRLEDELRGPNVLPPYTEIAKLDRLERLPAAELARRSRALLAAHLARRPRGNPVEAHRMRLEADLTWLREEPIGTFHSYAFATARQLGACFELLASYLRWLGAIEGRAAEAAALGCDEIASTAKALQFKLARVVTYRKDANLAELFDRLAASWERVMLELDRHHAA